MEKLMTYAGQHSARLTSVDLSKIDFIAVLARVSAVFLSIGSYFTSFLGACLYVSNNIPVAFMLSTGFQIGVFVFSHGAVKVNDPRCEKISKPLRVCAFIPCLVFSAYMSTLGTYAVLRPSIEAGEERSALQSKLTVTSYAQNQLSTAALGYLNEQLLELAPLVEAQKRRLQFARKPFSRIAAQRALDKLNARLGEVNRAKEVVANTGQVSDAMPESSSEARQRIDESIARSSSILAAMPADFRDAHQLPPPDLAPPTASDIQGSFIRELRRGAAAAYYCLAIALLLDITSILIIRSITPTATLPERIRRGRRYLKDLRDARSQPLVQFNQQIRMLVTGFPDLSGNLDLGTESLELYLEDLKPHFRHVEQRLGEEMGRPVEIRSVRSSTGMELLPGLPLKSQLDSDNTIHLLTEPVDERAKKT
jgi:hypothetical protein